MKRIKWQLETQKHPYRRGLNLYKLSRPKLIGKGYLDEDGIVIEGAYRYNGSGGKFFGGASEWPVADVLVSFEAKQERDRDKFIRALQRFLDEYFK